MNQDTDEEGAVPTQDTDEEGAVPTYSSSNDVYKYLVDDSDEAWIFGLTAFAIFEQSRIEWERHFEQRKDRPPTPEEVGDWYEQHAEASLIRAKGDAENALIQYSNATVEEALLVETERIRDDVIVSEIRLGRRFWPQFGVNLAGSVTGALLFAAILVILYLFVLTDPSALDLVREGADEETVIGQGGLGSNE